MHIRPGYGYLKRKITKVVNSSNTIQQLRVAKRYSRMLIYKLATDKNRKMANYILKSTSLKKEKELNCCGLPTNDGDLEGIYKYLIWEAVNAGLSSSVLHYIEVLFIKAIKEDMYGKEYKRCKKENRFSSK